MLSHKECTNPRKAAFRLISESFTSTKELEAFNLVKGFSRIDLTPLALARLAGLTPTELLKSQLKNQVLIKTLGLANCFYNAQTEVLVAWTVEEIPLVYISYKDIELLSMYGLNTNKWEFINDQAGVYVLESSMLRSHNAA